MMRGLEDLEVGRSVELVNGKPSKRRTIGTPGKGKMKILAVDDHPESNNAIVYKWIDIDPISQEYYDEQKIKDELNAKEAQVERKAIFLERKSRLEELEKREKEVEKALTEMKKEEAKKK